MVMSEFRFYHPIEVRYGDLDPQGHVNNASYLTYMEQSRVAYIQHLGLWQGDSFLEFGVILAEAKVIFFVPIVFSRPVQVGVCVSRLGNKSFTMEYCVEDAQSDHEYATGTSVLVAYDYHNESTIPIPNHWRQTISDFEHL
jgi:acyl-CoA thioester hydrolase